MVAMVHYAAPSIDWATFNANNPENASRLQGFLSGASLEIAQPQQAIEPVAASPAHPYKALLEGVDLAKIKQAVGKQSEIAADATSVAMPLVANNASKSTNNGIA